MDCNHRSVTKTDTGYFCHICRQEISAKDLGDMAACPRCKQVKTNPEDIGWIREFGYCLSCDHVDGEKNAEIN